MTTELFSPLWYRVANLRPTLRRQAEIHRHRYRGALTFVLQDHASGRSHRFTPPAHHFLALMDGKRSVQEIWDLTEDALGDDAPTQEDAIELLSRLYAADLLKADTPPDTRELFRRYQSRRMKKLRQRFASPFSITIPLINPDRFLERWMPYVRPLFGWFGLIIWFGTVTTALILAGSHWPDLTENLADRVLTAQNLFLIWLLYPLVKILHELGHGFAAKHRGCEVPALGVMLIALIPMPYVDASASAALPNRYQRMFIAAAGIMVEVLLAALALFVWLSVEPGIVRALAFNVMVIGGVSTIVFNGNPLLRFDGYYILADALDIPDLATRSKQYLGYLFRRYVGGVADAASPVVYTGERFWLFNYAIASNVFRIGVMVGIILFIAGKFFMVGVILAAWGATTQIFFPIVKGVAFLMGNPQLQGHRARAIGTTGAVLTGMGLLLFVAPFPLHTATEGVVWAPEKSEIRASTDGIIERLVAEPYALAEPGDVLLELDDPVLGARVVILAAELEGARAQYQSLRTEKQLEADILLEQITTIEADLALARERLDELVIRSPTKGFFLLDRSQDLVGRFVRQGDLIGFVAELSTGTVRVAVTQANMGLIRNRTESVSIRLAEQLDKPLAATISREMPLATHRIPSAVLGTMGGGLLAIDPGDQSGTRTLDPVFHIELTFDAPVDRLGGRTYVRFDHGTEPLGFQWYRRIRQLLLRQFNV